MTENDPRLILFVLAAVFSAMFALNAAFIRHLRQAHIPVRRKKREGS